MIDSPTLRSLGIAEAAAFLHIHKTTLQERARAGIIPGAKIGRSWVFLEADLAAYLRGQYKFGLNTLVCPSINSPAAKSGTPASRSRATAGYASRLDSMIAKRRKSATTNS